MDPHPHSHFELENIKHKTLRGSEASLYHQKYLQLTTQSPRSNKVLPGGEFVSKAVEDKQTHRGEKISTDNNNTQQPKIVSTFAADNHYRNQQTNKKQQHKNQPKYTAIRSNVASNSAT
ncbi:unnamed protein product [Ceratitis capitata]|uniref:(Mediterranean fruit fly) hypothetical protein n=1 Tax=Ceratitis capitata TaxID=7213 RepID=A0A811UM03_CERCA|nr:unnamed protein product [Ceratitis capitata]